MIKDGFGSIKFFYAEYPPQTYFYLFLLHNFSYNLELCKLFLTYVFSCHWQHLLKPKFNYISTKTFNLNLNQLQHLPRRSCTHHSHIQIFEPSTNYFDCSWYLSTSKLFWIDAHDSWRFKSRTAHPGFSSQVLTTLTTHNVLQHQTFIYRCPWFTVSNHTLVNRASKLLS